jgi:hypothetical protein
MPFRGGVPPERKLSFCHIYQFVKICPSKKPFFSAKLPGSRKKGRNLRESKKRFAFFLMVND